MTGIYFNRFIEELGLTLEYHDKAIASAEDRLTPEQKMRLISIRDKAKKIYDRVMKNQVIDRVDISELAVILVEIDDALEGAD